MTRVLVCGGRAYEDRQRVFEILAQRQPSVVIQGCARGADSFAGEWADLNGVEHLRFPADWDNLGRAAGPIRNQQMLDEGRPDLVIAFPGSKGTRDMMRRAVLAGVPVEMIDPTPAQLELIESLGKSSVAGQDRLTQPRG